MRSTTTAQKIRKKYEGLPLSFAGGILVTCTKLFLNIVKFKVAQVWWYSRQLVRLKNMPVMGSRPEWNVLPYVGLTILLC